MRKTTGAESDAEARCDVCNEPLETPLAKERGAHFSCLAKSEPGAVEWFEK